MMGDLIERDKIYEAVYDLACKSVGVIGGISEDYACGLREAAHMIEEAPAVDAVPPKAHGEWIWHEDEFSYECSACHCQFDYYHTYGIFDHGYEYATYCPNCGSKMNGEGDVE